MRLGSCIYDAILEEMDINLPPKNKLMVKYVEDESLEEVIEEEHEQGNPANFEEVGIVGHDLMSEDAEEEKEDVRQVALDEIPNAAGLVREATVRKPGVDVLSHAPQSLNHLRNQDNEELSELTVILANAHEIED